MSVIEDIQQKGWSNSSIDVSISDRAHLAALGNKVIDLALQDSNIHKALTFGLLETDDKRAYQANLFTVSPALHSADQKLWIHVGYQTRHNVEAILGDKVPLLLREFLDMTDRMLAAIERSFTQMLHELNADAVVPIIFDPDTMNRVIHIRIVRYIGARHQDSSREPVSGHADMSLCTLHLFETHGNWFQAAPYDQSIINNDQSSAKNIKVANMRARLKLLDAIEGQPIFFLGAGWKHLGLRNLPACYHAGIRPEPENEFVSPYAKEVIDNDADRVSLVVFAQPSLAYIQDHSFTYPSVTECRPDTAVEL